MKLALIYESETERLTVRVKRALLGNGRSERQGLFGVADEFGCDLEQAAKLLNTLKSGTYGEEDIEDKTLHRARAPQCLWKLLKHFKVQDRVARKLVRFHIDNHQIISKHRESPVDQVSLQQLMDGERLASLLTMPKDHLTGLGLTAKLAPWYDDGYKKDYPHGLFYVSWPEDEDILDELAASDGLRRDLLNGLAFGYKMVDVLNYVRSNDKELVDTLCGNVNTLPR